MHLDLSLPHLIMQHTAISLEGSSITCWMLISWGQSYLSHQMFKQNDIGLVNICDSHICWLRAMWTHVAGSGPKQVENCDKPETDWVGLDFVHLKAAVSVL